MLEGDSDLLLEEFVQYLTTISTKSSSLLRQRYAEVFEALETARGPNNSESHEDRLAQILIDIQEGSQNYNEVDNEEEEHSEEESEDDSRGIVFRQAMTKKMKKRLRRRMKKIVHLLTMSRAMKTTPPFTED